jgi:hypothetical protein
MFSPALDASYLYMTGFALSTTQSGSAFVVRACSADRVYTINELRCDLFPGPRLAASGFEMHVDVLFVAQTRHRGLKTGRPSGRADSRHTVCGSLGWVYPRGRYDAGVAVLWWKANASVGRESSCHLCARQSLRALEVWRYTLLVDDSCRREGPP